MFNLGLTKDNIITEIQNEVNYQLDSFDVKDVDKLIDLIKKSNNIFFCGIGKSGIMAEYCCDLLKSISISSFFLSITNLLHGDLGCVKENDLIIIFSKSGKTKEIKELFSVIDKKGCNIIGICCDKENGFENYILLPFKKEISGNLDLIPTNSCMIQLIFSNILCSKLKEDISREEYKMNHSSGTIGLSS
jgi:arabinose-5-phosphate isomerase